MVTEIAGAIEVEVALLGVGGGATIVTQVGHSVPIFVAEATQLNEKCVPAISAILTEREPVAAADGAVRFRDERARADRHASLLLWVACRASSFQTVGRAWGAESSSRVVGNRGNTRPSDKSGRGSI